MVADTIIQTTTTSICTEGWESLCLEALDSFRFGWIIEIIFLIMAFLSLAILCDDYLMPAIECLCLRHKIREDVAGAILVALGSSAPEIIINAIASMKGQVDSVELGIGAVIGSGCIAFLLIPAICTLFSPTTPVEIKRRPLLRDVGFYFISLLLVIWFISDGEISLFEAGTLFSLYFIYLLVVVFSSKIRFHFQLKKLSTDEEKQKLLLKRSISFVDLVKQQKEDDLRSKINAAHDLYAKVKPEAKTPSTPGFNKPLSILQECDDEEVTTTHDLDSNLEPLRYQQIYNTFGTPSLLQQNSTGSNSSNNSTKTQFEPLIKISNDDVESPLTSPSTSSLHTPDLKRRSSTPHYIIDDVDDEDGSEDTVCANPITNLLYTILTKPSSLAFEYTIPEAKPHGEKEHLYPISFVISFLYLAFFSMVISAIFSRWTVITGLGGDFFGLLLVSAAAELPDLVQSIAASKAGYSSMAMSCLASQIANILIGFGLSWFVAILARGAPILVPGYSKLIHSASIQVFNVIFFAIITLGFALWYQTPKVHMVKFKAQLMLVVYVFSVIGFAICAFLLHTRA